MMGSDFSYPPLFAHRGASAYSPENTLAGLRLAAEMGALWVEIDVQLTADGHVVVIHDTTVRRVANQRGKVATMTLAQLQSLDVGAWFSSAFKGEQIPTLMTYLEEAQSLGLSLNIELKPSRRHMDALVTAVLAALKSHWRQSTERLLLSSQSQSALESIKQQAPELRLAWVGLRWSDRTNRALVSRGVIAVHYPDHQCHPVRIKAAQALGLFVGAFTVNDQQRAQMFFANGGDGIFSDDPTILKDSL